MEIISYIVIVIFVGILYWGLEKNASKEISKPLIIMSIIAAGIIVILATFDNRVHIAKTIVLPHKPTASQIINYYEQCNGVGFKVVRKTDSDNKYTWYVYCDSQH